MRFLLFTAFILTTLIACSDKSKVVSETGCFISYDSLFKVEDTSKLEVARNTDSAAIEVLDRKTSDEERGIFRFGENGNLQLYAFIYNEHNDANFFIKYDSLGNHLRSTNHEVVQWNFYTPKDSTIKFTFFLCAIDRNYRDIKIECGKFKKDKIVLLKSKFIKLDCANISINKSDLDSSKKIYITGLRQDKCSKKVESFTDSTNAL